MSLRSSIVIVLVRQIFGATIGLLLTVLLARTLTVSDNGLYASLSLVPLLASTVASLGVAPATVYFLGSKTFELSEIIFSTVFLGLVGAACAVLVLVAMKNGGLLPSHLSLQPITFVWAMSATFPVLVFSNASAILQGAQRFQAFGFLTILPPLISLCLIIIIHITAPNGLTVFDAIAVLVVAYVVGCLAIFLYIARQWSLSWRPAIHYLRCIAAMLSYGTRAHIGNVLGILNYRLNYYIILDIVGPTSVGMFAVTAAICEALWIISSAAAAVIFPMAASNDSTSPEGFIKTLTVARWVFYLTSLATILLVAALWPIIHFALGAAYRSIDTLIYILIPGVLSLSFARVLANDIAGRGKPMINTLIAGAALLVNTLVNFLLLPVIGLIGAAVAASISYTLLAGLTVLAYARLSNMSTKYIIRPSPLDFVLAKKVIMNRLKL